MAGYDDPADGNSDRLASALDEIEILTQERELLRSRVDQLERERLERVEAEADGSDPHRRLVELTKENQELHVVLRNSDLEGLLQRQEKQHLRQQERSQAYTQSLERMLEEERQVSFRSITTRRRVAYTLLSCTQRVAQFERFVLQSFSTQASALAAAAAPELDFYPGETPAELSPAFLELDRLPVSHPLY